MVRSDAKNLPTHARATDKLPLKLENMFQVSVPHVQDNVWHLVSSGGMCAQRRKEMFVKDLDNATCSAAYLKPK